MFDRDNGFCADCRDRCEYVYFDGGGPEQFDDQGILQPVSLDEGLAALVPEIDFTKPYGRAEMLADIEQINAQLKEAV